MEENTTTGAPSEDAGAIQPQLINGIAVDDQGQALPVTDDEQQAPAVAETTESNEATEEQTSTGATTEALPVADDKLAKFAKGQGIEDINELSKRELSLLKSAYDNKADRDRAASQASELQKTTEITQEQIAPDATPEQRDNIRLRNLELKYEISNWRQSNPEKAKLEPEMVGILTSDPTKRQLVQEGYLSYDDLYAMARGNNTNTDSLVADTKRATLENLAHTQQAAVPRGNAVNTVPSDSGTITPQNVDSMVASMSPDEYRKRLPEINKALGGR